eukprot:3940662-Rhodomonas_salina.2
MLLRTRDICYYGHVAYAATATWHMLLRTRDVGWYGQVESMEGKLRAMQDVTDEVSTVALYVTCP